MNPNYVFTSWDGSDLHPHASGNWLRRFCKEHRLPNIVTHVFRHLSATFLISAGTDVRTVSGKLGHANTRTTLTVYAHLLRSSEQETANIMQDVPGPGLRDKADKATDAKKKAK